MMNRRMWSLALGLVCVGMTLSVSGHAGWLPQKPQAVASMGMLDLPGLKKPITKRFVNAKLPEVLAWLSLEQFSFVADAAEFPGQGQVTLNFRNQPLGAVLDAIADAFNGRWERRGDIFSLRPGYASRGLFSTEMPALPGLAQKAFVTPSPRIAEPGARSGQSAPPASVTTPSPRVYNLTPPTIARTLETAPRMATPAMPPLAITEGAKERVSKIYAVPPVADVTTTWSTQDPKSNAEVQKAIEQAMREAEKAMRQLHESGEWHKAMEKAMAEARSHQDSDEMRKAMEQVRKSLQDMPKSEEWKKAWESARAAMQKALKEGKVRDGGKERKMTDKERAALEKSLESLKSVDVPVFKFDKLFDKMPDGKTFVMPKVDGKTFVMPKIDGKAFAFPKMEGKNFTFVTPDDKEFSLRNKEIQKHIEEMNKHMREFKLDESGKSRVFAVPEMKGLEGLRPFTINSSKMRISELLDSLTAEQKVKQEKQGYLTLADLTEKQKAMLGSIPSDGNWTFSYSIDGKKLTIKSK